MKNKLEPINGLADDALPQDHEVKDWADTLMRAEEIKADPKKMVHVQKHLNKKVKAIHSIAGLKMLAKEKRKAAALETPEEEALD